MIPNFISIDVNEPFSVFNFPICDYEDALEAASPLGWEITLEWEIYALQLIYLPG